MHQMKVIGVTGGSGAGKSVLCSCLKALGAAVINADAVYHMLLEESDKLRWSIEDAFPEALSGKRLDRKKLAEIVFGDSVKLKRLNELTHPAVIEEVSRIMAQYEADGAKVCVLEAIYLLETDFAQMSDLTVAVVCDIELRIKRVCSRDNITEKQAWERISSQQSDDHYAGFAQEVIDTTKISQDKLRERAEELLNQVCEN